jgi:hypothetical protein
VHTRVQRRKELSRVAAKHSRFAPWVTLAQAEAYATEIREDSLWQPNARILRLSLHNLSALPLLGSRRPCANDSISKELAVSQPLERAAEAVARGEAATIRSVILRLEVGVVYCKLAASTNDEATAERIRIRAQAALDSAVSVAEHLSLMGNDRAEFDDKAENLRAALRETF